MTKLTKQGVRDLGRAKSKSRESVCFHEWEHHPDCYVCQDLAMPGRKVCDQRCRICKMHR